MNDLHGKRRNIDFLSDAEIIEIAKRVGLPIVHIPCDTAEGSFVATVDLIREYVDAMLASAERKRR